LLEYQPRQMKKYSLFIFFILTFALTWSMWVPAVWIKAEGSASLLGPDSPVGQLARWAPGIAAIILTAIITRKKGVGELFRPLKAWRVNVGWYLFALLFQPVLFIVARWIDSLFGNTYEIISPLSSVDAPIAFVVPVVIITAIPGAFMEELGWRGFALPRLQNKNNALFASIILGLIWGIWHIPSMMYFGGANAWNITWAVLNFIPATLLFTWLFNNTKGSLLLVTLYHASVQYSNNFLGVIPTQTANYLLWLTVIFILVIAGTDNLSKSSERVQSE
jgi:uncharacterized protein